MIPGLNRWGEGVETDFRLWSSEKKKVPSHRGAEGVKIRKFIGGSLRLPNDNFTRGQTPNVIRWGMLREIPPEKGGLYGARACG